jgi:hypothetical protein
MPGSSCATNFLTTRNLNSDVNEINITCKLKKITSAISGFFCFVHHSVFLKATEHNICENGSISEMLFSLDF